MLALLHHSRWNQRGTGDTCPHTLFNPLTCTHSKYETIVSKLTEYFPDELKEQRLRYYISRKVEQIGYLLIGNLKLKEFASKELSKKVNKNQANSRLSSKSSRNSLIETWSNSCFLSNYNWEHKLQSDIIVDTVLLLWSLENIVKVKKLIRDVRKGHFHLGRSSV